MPDQRYLARLTARDSTVELLAEDWRWHPVSGANVELLTELANLYIPHDYSYSPADGQPGARLAHLVARRLKATVELPESPPTPPGAVY